MSVSPVTASPRILSLESVRGLAAFAVVLSHLVMAFADPYPTGRPARIETLPNPLPILLELVYRPIRDGQFAVMVFFVLSGVVLSQGYFQRGRFADVIDAIVPEPEGGAHTDAEAIIAATGELIRRQLADLLLLDVPTLLDQRYAKYRAIGHYQERQSHIFDYTNGNGSASFFLPFT